MQKDTPEAHDFVRRKPDFVVSEGVETREALL